MIDNMRVLITGVTGMVGSYLAEMEYSRGNSVYGVVRWRSDRSNIKSVEDVIHLWDCDLTDAFAVIEMINTIKPHMIYHMAAQSFVKESWGSPEKTLSNNILGTLNILEAVRNMPFSPRILVAGTSEEYGAVMSSELPIKETTPLRPASPYAVSKVTQEMLALQYARSYGHDVIVTRAFNHEGPRRGHVFVTSNFAKQVAEMEKGLRPAVLKVGNLEAQRDYTDVRDMVQAYQLAISNPYVKGVYNIASGKAHKIQEVVDLLQEFSTINFTVEQDPSRMRPSDIPILLGDSTRFREVTGWEPKIPFEVTMKDTLWYWRQLV